MSRNRVCRVKKAVLYPQDGFLFSVPAGENRNGEKKWDVPDESLTSWVVEVSNQDALCSHNPSPIAIGWSYVSLFLLMDLQQFKILIDRSY